MLKALGALKPEIEIVFIDDASTDETPERLRSNGCRVIRNPRRLGYSGAIRTALEAALKSDTGIIVLMDSDGQHDPAAVPDAIEAFRRTSSDLLIGSRYVRKTDYRTPLERRIAMIFFSWLTYWIAGKRIHDTTSGFKILSRRAARLALSYPVHDLHSEFIIGLLRAGQTVNEIAIDVKPRQYGRSMHSWKSAFRYPFHTLKAIFAVLSVEVQSDRNGHRI